MDAAARAYFITFRTYGTWLPGDPRGTVDRQHRGRGEPFAPASAGRQARARSLMPHSPVLLSQVQRAAVRTVVSDVCTGRGWTLHALAVQTNHLHVVLTAPERPEVVMQELKAKATRRMVALGLATQGSTVWARHGSTRRIYGERGFEAAVGYVSHWQ